MNKKMLIFHFDMNFSALRYDVVENMLHTLVELGYNTILWELEDKVCFDTFYEAVHPLSFSKEEFRSLLHEAEKLGFENIPLLQTIGHAEYILKHPLYQHLRELPEEPTCYCVSNPKVQEFLKKLIDEYLELFGTDIRFFHLGGDEAAFFGRCRDCVKHERNELYAGHVKSLAAPLIERGIRPGIWSDMILAHPETINSIPRKFIIWDWNYWDGIEPYRYVKLWKQCSGDPFTIENLPSELIAEIPELIDKNGKQRPFYYCDFLKRMGFDVILAAASRSFGDSVFLCDWHIHSRNIAGAAIKVEETSLFGLCVTSWAIRLPLLNGQIPLFALAPAFLKTPEENPKLIFDNIAQKYFALPSEDALAKLSRNDTVLNFLTMYTAPNYSKEVYSFSPGDTDKILKETVNKEDLLNILDLILTDNESALKFFNPDISESASIWCDAGELKIRTLKAVRKMLTGESLRENDRIEADQLFARFTKHLLKESTEFSAYQNAKAVYSMLKNYLM